MNLNKVMLIGNLTRDPEMKSTPSGQNVTTFALATNMVWTDPQGQRKEKAEFHNIVAWRKLAEICSQYLRKGSRVYVEGRLQTRTWDDAQGNKKYWTEIVMENMIMLDRKGETSGGHQSTPTQNFGNNPQPQARPAAPVEEIPTIQLDDPMSQGVNVDEVPF